MMLVLALYSYTRVELSSEFRISYVPHAYFCVDSNSRVEPHVHLTLLEFIRYCLDMQVVR